MRLSLSATLLLAAKAALVQVAILTGAFFAEAVFPLGDCRWLVISVASILALGVLVYFEHKKGARRGKDQKSQRQVDQLLRGIDAYLTSIDRAMLMELYQTIMKDREEPGR